MTKLDVVGAVGLFLVAGIIFLSLWLSVEAHGDFQPVSNNISCSKNN